jgi:hypothetical protein
MNKKTIIYSVSTLTVLFIFGCAHHKDVRAGADGVHRVVIRSETKEEGERESLSQAKSYCDEKKKEAVIVSENSKYTGDMKEEDYKTMKTASKAAEIVGGTAHVFGGKNESNVGGIVGLGGVVANQVAGNGYTVEMTFKCQ